MSKTRLALAVLLALSIIPLRLAAQENGTTLKVQVTITESEGEKKLVNLPYTFYVKASDGKSGNPPWTKLRIGSRVPVYTGKDDGITYIDVGTNIDSRAFTTDNGRFDIYLNLERSWVEGDLGDIGAPTGKSSGPATDAHSAHLKEQIIRQFKSELSFSMRDGQTTQTTQAPDPLSGRILATTVTMTVVK
ncbi:MAG: hypothetical protein WBR26_09280 [Candidatus Acidiferrum sp.]